MRVLTRGCAVSFGMVGHASLRLRGGNMIGHRNMTLREAYDNYIALADDGTGCEIGTGLPLKTFDEWLAA